MLRLAFVVRLLMKWTALLTLFYVVYLMAQFTLHQRIAATTTSVEHDIDVDVMIDRDVRRRHNNADVMSRIEGRFFLHIVLKHWFL